MTGPGGGLKALGFDTFADIDMGGEVSQAYEGLRNAPVLDVTTGKTAFGTMFLPFSSVISWQKGQRSG